MNLILSVAVLVVTLALVLTRPRELNEAYGAAVGAALTLLLRLATPGDVGGVLRETGNVLLFLFGMMIVTGVVEAAGVFDILAHMMAQRFGTSGRGLLIGIFLLGALVTAFLSLDVTIIVLTPIVFAATQRLRVDPVPASVRRGIRSEYGLAVLANLEPHEYPDVRLASPPLRALRGGDVSAQSCRPRGEYRHLSRDFPSPSATHD